MNSDGESFLSADDLRINLWNLDNSAEGFSCVLSSLSLSLVACFGIHDNGFLGAIFIAYVYMYVCMRVFVCLSCVCMCAVCTVGVFVWW